MPVCFLLLLASAGGLSLRESVLRKRLIPRKRVWLRDASVGGRTGKPKGGATADPAATRGGLRLWLTKAHVAQEGTRGKNESLLGVCTAKMLYLRSFCCSKRDHPPTSMSLERLRLYLASVFQRLCQWKVWKGKQVLESRGCSPDSKLTVH